MSDQSEWIKNQNNNNRGRSIDYKWSQAFRETSSIRVTSVSMACLRACCHHLILTIDPWYTDLHSCFKLQVFLYTLKLPHHVLKVTKQDYYQNISREVMNSNVCHFSYTCIPKIRRWWEISVSTWMMKWEWIKSYLKKLAVKPSMIGLKFRWSLNQLEIIRYYLIDLKLCQQIYILRFHWFNWYHYVIKNTEK